MLEFNSASVRIANPERAVNECLDVALGPDETHCDLVIINASIGHNLQDLVDATRKRLPDAQIVAGSCAGVVGREGVSESLKDVALMTVNGPNFKVAFTDNIRGDSAREKAQQMAMSLREGASGYNMVYLLVSGIDIANDQVIAGFQSVLGPDVTLFGATTSDNMRGIASYQAVDQHIFDHGAIAIGFHDPSLEVVTQATHGFVASGDPLIVTRASGNRIHELNGRNAWDEYRFALGLDKEATLADTIPIGALAEELRPAQVAEYGNNHILRVVTHVDEDGSLVYATEISEGTPLWLTVRDEELIFSDLERLINVMGEVAKERKPVAVFQADCLARGRRLFNRIIKEELVQRMQFPFSDEQGPPPWLGMYGFGEYARLLGENTYHNYTTALAAIYRK